MRVLVTGAAGFVGGNVVRFLLKEGHQVRAMVHRDQRAVEGLPVEIVQADLLRPETLTGVLDDMDAVIHTAAKVSINGDPDGMVQKTNVRGVAHLVDASLKARIQRFVHFSSIHAFREEGQEVVNEQSPSADERSFEYDQSKRAGELEVLKGVERGLNAVILNPAAIYGPHDFVPSLTGKMLLDFYYRKIPMLTPGGYNFSDVRDIAQTAVNALSKGKTGERYLLGNRWISVKEMALMTEEVTGVPAPQFTSPIFLAYLGLPVIKLVSKLSGIAPLYTRESLHILSLGKNIDDSKAVRELDHKKREPIKTIRDAYDWFDEMGML